MLWSQRDLETSIESFIQDLEDHIDFIAISTGEDLHGFKKQAAHIRYELRSTAKKIEDKFAPKYNS